MAVPQFSDEVQVVLSTIDPPNPPCIPLLRDRYLLLTKENPTVTIGRTSKRDVKLEPARNNAWIDSAVMSRAHAVLDFDADAKKVFIKDIGSLHGTFCNGTRLATHTLQHIEQGDTLTFGIAVERSMQAFPPCTMRVLLVHGTEPRPENKPVVFRVPDDTDASDDDFSIRESTTILQENGFHPAQSGKTSSSIPVDLTSEDGEGGWHFDDLQVNEGQRVDPKDWESCSSVVSPATSPVLDPRASSMTAPARAPGKDLDSALDDDHDVETDGDESVDLDGALGFNLTSAPLPTGLPSLMGGYDDVGLEQPKAIADQDMARDLPPSSHRCFDPDSTIMLSSPAAQPTQETQPPCLSAPALDETSAYQFELSKKAAATNAVFSEATYIETGTDPKRPSNDQPSLKRKAEDISESSLEEERTGIEPFKEPARTSSKPVLCAVHARSLKALVSEVEGSRASKRFRRAAEVFGFAAIGGVAVMSALIATAPAL